MVVRFSEHRGYFASLSRSVTPAWINFLEHHRFDAAGRSIAQSIIARLIIDLV